jgi:lipopolysaccharide biosynthesis regulator YciM
MELPPTDQRHLEHAAGYLELGMVKDAREEIEQIPPERRETPTVMQVRLAILMEDREWSRAVEIARKLTVLDPQECQWLISLAYATRRADSIESARKILLEAANRFPKEALIPYNLGCYEAQLGNLEVAVSLVRKAIDMDRTYREKAREDPDLEPIRQMFETI